MNKSLDTLVARRQQIRKGRATPNPISVETFLAAGRGRTGNWKASETGATTLAQRRAQYSSERKMMDTAGKGTRSFEDYIQKGR
jgi:hypothetical protein